MRIIIYSVLYRAIVFIETNKTLNPKPLYFVYFLHNGSGWRALWWEGRALEQQSRGPKA